jgi:hypothetical protein
MLPSWNPIIDETIRKVPIKHNKGGLKDQRLNRGPFLLI